MRVVVHIPAYYLGGRDFDPEKRSIYLSDRPFVDDQIEVPAGLVEVVNVRHCLAWDENGRQRGIDRPGGSIEYPHHYEVWTNWVHHPGRR